jgi:hypothetical protein
MHRSRESLAAVTAALTFTLAAAAVLAGTKPAARDVERGRYLVTAGGCNDCHTPWKLDPELKMPVPDMSRMLSGHPSDAPGPASTYNPPDIGVIGPTFTSFRLPVGTVYSANLTPDAQTGLGGWTETMFVAAMRSGRHLGDGRPILPPMPWMNAASLTDEDLRAVFAFLRSIPAINNAVPPPAVPPDVLQSMTSNLEKLKAAAARQK